MQLRPYQEEAVAAVYDHLRKHDDNPCVVLPTGCHAIDHPIRMYDGSIRRVQDVRVGELLMGEDSTPRRVLALCRGREPMARVLPADGEPFVVNQNHILSLRNARSEVVNLTVQAYRRQSPDWQRGHHLWRVRSGRVIEHVPFRLAELPEDDFYGFALDGNHLYLDGNDVVHHNTGKSLVLARIATDAVQLWSGRVLILAHVKELLEQNADKIQRLCPGLQIGIYSAGLKRRDTDHAVIVAGIQSVYTRAREFGPFDLAIVDEAHTIPGGKSGEGMYRQFLEAAEEINPNLRVIGLTATPYRLKGGEICQADNVLNAVCYEANIRDMIMQGYLSKLRSRSGTATADLSQVEVRGGEFVASAMEAAMDRSDLVKAACQEIVELSRDRCSVLLFTAGVAHCEHVAREIEQLTGDACGIVTGETPADERAEILARFRGEDCSTLTEKKPPLKYLANVNVLTTGFDATAIDCVVMLRPTMSTGLYVQMVGRGTRLHAGKEDCLVLDYAGNVQRHGPLDLVEVHSEGGKEKKQATSKECPNCNARIDVSYRFCPHCQFCFPPPEPPKLDVQATTAEVLEEEIRDEDCAVQAVCYTAYLKRDADPGHPRTMMVEYRVGWYRYVREWVCPEHTGWARSKFVKWWLERCALPPPTSAAEAVHLAKDGALAPTQRITVRSSANARFDRIIGYQLGPIPDYCPEPGWNDAADEPEPEPLAMAAADDFVPF